MTVLAIFGDCPASGKLTTAALDDTLEAHLADAPGEDFWLVIGVRKPMAIYETIIGWALRNEIYVAVYTPHKDQALGDLINECHRSERFMLDAVDRTITEGGGKIYALIGDQEPSVDVRRALVRALDSGLEVRDLAEAGLTYVGVSDNPLTIGSNTMANDLTLAEAGEAADNENEESMLALTELAEQYGLDPDEFETWSALAAALDETLADEPEEAEEATEVEEVPEEAPKARGGSKLAKMSREDLEGTPVPDLRSLAKGLGVEGWDKNRSAKLIEGILEAQEGGGAPAAEEEEPAEDEDYPPKRRAERTNGAEAPTGFFAKLAEGLRAFADVLDQ